MKKEKAMPIEKIPRRAGAWLAGALLALMGFAGSGCAGEEMSDAYGQFEADRVTVSSEASGTLMRYEVREGEELESGREVGLVDTTQLALQMDEVRAQMATVRSRLKSVEAEAEVLGEELELAKSELRRIASLEADSAATRRQLDEARARVRTLQKRIAALRARESAVEAELEPLRVRLRQLRYRLDKARIVNPVQGRVLNSLVERHELVSEGQPLYEIAELDTLLLRVYVSGGQLPRVSLGQRAEVLVDAADGELRSLRGRVSWISSEAEFTPRMIQTREERVSQVYALKVRVANPEGLLKIGMPGEVNFREGGE